MELGKTSFNDWSELRFWNSGEWQKIEEDLDDFDRRGIRYCPQRAQIFRALRLTPFTSVKVAIVGQDPYPNDLLATGVAFSIPKGCINYPPTLQNIFHEYSDIHGDLKYPYPTSGCLETWSSRGVLLWNAFPILPRIDEFSYLTQEIVERLNKNEILLVTLGNVAKSFTDGCRHCLNFSHPSPLGWTKGIRPFKGNRFFSTINDYLCGMNEEPIDWRLP
jgi:uracil-DNA glycosylase